MLYEQVVRDDVFFYKKEAKVPANTTDVMVTVTNPPTSMDGNIRLMRNSFSSGDVARESQVDSVMMILGGKPYRAVRPLAKAR